MNTGRKLLTESAMHQTDDRRDQVSDDHEEAKGDQEREVPSSFSKFVVFDRFRHIIIETSTCSILNLIGHRIGGESHNRNLGIVILHFPSANLTTRFVTIFDRHLDITLASNVSFVGSYDRRVNGSFYLQ